jgi:putative cardiolipin synthase
MTYIFIGFRSSIIRIFLKRTVCAFSLALVMAQGAQAFETPPSSSPYLNTVNAPHQVRLLDNDTAALENVLQMVERARTSIEMEYFVFNPDRSGRLVLQALVRKADEGVKIRILVDYNANGVKPGLDSFYHDELARHGIELRYFNVAELWKFWVAGFRNHRKLLVIDDEEMLTGGRNIADGYFGMSEHMDYLDRDVWIKGPIAQTAVRGFDLFWNNPVVTNPEKPEVPVLRRRTNPASSKMMATQSQDEADYQARLVAFSGRITTTRASLRPQSSDLEFRQEVAKVGEVELAKSPVVTIHSITLVSDTPVPGDSARVVTPYLYQRIGGAKKSLLIENFMFMVKDEEKHALLGLLERGVKIDLLTNGFDSEPNFLMAELAHSRQNMGVHHGMNVYCYCGPPKSDQMFSGSKAIWGLHTKTMVIDGRDSVIGSYNFDPRSGWINDEGAIIVNNSPEFASLLEEKTRNRIKDATQMNQDGSYANGSHCYSAGRILTIILRPLAEMVSDQL